MAKKKETFAEYRNRTQSEMKDIEAQIQEEELVKLQYEHQMERIQNFTEYQLGKKNKARNHRLITKGAAIESVCEDSIYLDETEFYQLAEEVFGNSEMKDRIRQMVPGRKELAEEKGLSETQVMENAFALYKRKEDSGKAEKFVMDKFSGLETHLSDVEKRFDGLEQKVEKTVTHIDLLLSTISSSLQLLTAKGDK